MAGNNSTLLRAPLISSAELLTWYGSATLISIIGTLAGIALMLVIIKQHNFRDGTHPLIVQLLAVDCFTLAVPSFFANTEIYLIQTGRGSHVNCSAIFFLQYFLTCASHWIQVSLALNRCTAVLFPHNFRACSSKITIALMSAWSWTFPLALSVPYLFGVGASYGQVMPLGHCTLLVNNNTLFLILSSLVTTVPLCIEGLCYAIVLVAFRCQQKQIRPTAASRYDARRQKRRRKERALSLVLLICFLWYLVCYLPNTVISQYVAWYWRTHLNVFLWLRSLFGLAQAGTPFILVMGNAEFRVGMTQLLTFRCVAIVPLGGSSKWSVSLRGATSRKLRSSQGVADQSTSQKF
ncbi:uncharacterized protein LOC129581706 [Paramacrobiotus metropolitanus]|uniref:uncharacterized protein LOC129581706 n=1 Tax=Paramacrobiotus metropolitanus TaxID=2943436 RepID=UPI002445CF3F|nr:uncharacterized protein LOC129581706 [Paramacrobiotus metropolitanus]